MPKELDFDFFKIKFDKIAPQQGKILIAEPGLIDQYFKRSVIILVEHNENGTVGFVLNRLLDFSLPELLPDFPEFEVKVSIGGPVSPQSIHFIHTLGNKVPDTNKIVDGLYWGGDFNYIKSLITANKITSNQIRFFIGYSGWSVKQLEREITEESWVVSQLSPVQIMNGNDDLWIESIQELGKKFKPWTLYPENPSMN